MMKESAYIRKTQWAVLLSSLIVLLVLAGTLFRSNMADDWKNYQEAYDDIIRRIGDSLGIPMGFERGIYQVELPHFNRIDRCITCHNGLEDHRMESVDQPHTMHPGHFLADHPLQKFGCTICHGGQGRALTKDEAFGLDPSFHWSEPLRFEPYIQSACGKCHLSIFGSADSLEGTDAFMKGLAIFSSEGCLGCHKARGVGGILGPDLTRQGEKSKHDYSFQNVSGEQTVSNWLKEHFRDPEMVSPGSQMLKIDLPEEDLDELATFVMGLAKPEMPLEYFSMETLKELKGQRKILEGNDIYAFTCSACHGKNGEGKDYKEFDTGVPAIMNADFLRVASGEFIRFIVMKGRSTRQMSSWDPDVSGYKVKEIGSLVGYLESRIDREPFSDMGMSGEPGTGKLLYEKNCVTRHGENGAGGIGLALNKADFLKRADRDLIVRTIIKGRSTRQMSSWDPDVSGYKVKEIGSLVGYLESRIDREPYSDMRISGEPGTGKLLYEKNCVTCHGENGSGGIGLALNKTDFLKRADRYFIVTTIIKGRNNSGMPGWPQFTDRELSDLLAYFNTWYMIGSNVTDIHFPTADTAAGSLQFHYLCSRCHGEFGEGNTGPAIMDRDFLDVVSDGYLYETIAEGRMHTAMFGWSSDVYNAEALGKQDIADIIGFMRLHQVQRPAYIFPGSNPGDMKSGEALFSQHCATCHGREGEGPEAPALNNQEFLSAATNGYLTATITVGRKGTRMPSWGYPSEDHVLLTGQERQDIAAFIRSWQRIRIRK